MATADSSLMNIIRSLIFRYKGKYDSKFLYFTENLFCNKRLFLLIISPPRLIFLSP